jgi:hypothetical protein
MGSSPIEASGGEHHQLRLWRDNRTANLWTISEEELVSRFQAWPRRAETIIWRGIEHALRLFITDREDRGGLNSVFDEEPFQQFISRQWKRLAAANRDVDRELNP